MRKESSCLKSGNRNYIRLHLTKLKWRVHSFQRTVRLMEIMTTPYLYEGLILPERAQLTLQFEAHFKHLMSGISAVARVSVVLNQVAVWIYSDVKWDIFDLRNVVKNLLQNEVAVIGYLKGYAYEVEIRRVLHPELGVDYVFGIDIPCIAERNKSVDLATRIALIREKSIGVEGVLLNRCFSDLVTAMRNSEDTGFYCYGAIESLRQHCILKFNLNPENKAVQWKKLREVAQCEEETIRFIKAAADPIRHGNVISITSEDRETLFLKTWDIVDQYVENA